CSARSTTSVRHQRAMAGRARRAVSSEGAVMTAHRTPARPALTRLAIRLIKSGIEACESGEGGKKEEKKNTEARDCALRFCTPEGLASRDAAPPARPDSTQQSLRKTRVSLADEPGPTRLNNWAINQASRAYPRETQSLGVRPVAFRLEPSVRDRAI